MGDVDIIPSRDIPSQVKMARTAASARLADGDAAAQQAALQQRAVAKFSREELEDQYFKLYEHNIQLKKYNRNQDEKIKKMATKLLRFAQDKKKLDKADGTGRPPRSYEAEERIDDLNAQVAELTRKNKALAEKLVVMKQQLATGKRPTPQVYGHVQSRIDTGIGKTAPVEPVRSARSTNVRVMGPTRDHMSKTMGHSNRAGHGPIQEAAAENKRLHIHIDHQNEQINIYEQDIEMLQEQLRTTEEGYKEDILKIKQALTAEKRALVEENVDQLKLKRELRDKSTRLSALQAQFEEAKANMRALKGSHDTALREVESLNRQLQEEQSRVLELQSELKASGASRRAVEELHEQVNDYRKENNILREANEKLMSSAFDLEREREWRQKEHALKVQIAQLEATLKADLGEKGTVLDKLAAEKEGYDQLEADHRRLQIEYYKVKEELDDMTEKMKFFTKESAIDFTELEEALILVRSKKQKEESENLKFLHRVEDERDKDMEKAYVELQAEYADTVAELEKARTMLVTQHRINNDYRLEMEAATRKLDEEKQEFDTRMQELSQLADIRAARIRKLENQLADVAYGTRQYRLPAVEDDDVESIDETIHLERGQNVFEIHVSKANLSQDALQWIGDEEPSLLCTIEFFEFDTQQSIVVKGAKPDFDLTAQYVVTVDDFFLHYLQKDAAKFELHQSFGTEYRTIAACTLNCSQIIDTSHGRVHGQGVLTGCQDGPGGLSFGTVEFWARLRVPMEQALRLYRERCKAQGYVFSNEKAAVEATEALDEVAAVRPPDNVNQLHVKLMRGSDIKARRPDVQPSPYAVYKFFDFDDHDTDIVPSSNRPQFNDHKSFAVEMTSDLDKYLKAKHLDIYLFDDTDPDETQHLGKVSVPLIPLAHDKVVRGKFELKKADDSINGSLDVELKWQYTYISPRGETQTYAQKVMTPAVTRDATTSAAVKAEREALNAPRGPVASSTPLKQRDAELFSDSPLKRPPARKIQRARDPSAPKKHVTMRSEPEYEHEPVAGSVEGSVVSEGSRVSGESDILSSDESLGQLQAPVPQPPPRVTPASQALEEDISNSDTMEDGEAGLPPAPKPAARGPQKSVSRRMEPEEGEITVSADLESTGTQDYLNALASHDQEGMDEDSDINDVSQDFNQQVREEPDASESSYDETPRAITMSRTYESDSDGGVMAQSLTSHNTTGNPDSVSITVSALSLREGCWILDDDSIHKLFIEYRFLAIPIQETETPLALPKPQPGTEIKYNFYNEFSVDHEKFYRRRQFLARMLGPSDPDGGRIRFTVVAEPTNTGDCRNVGKASVSVHDIFASNRDIIDRAIPVFDFDDHEEQPENAIGDLKLSVQVLAALKAVKLELQTQTIRA